MGRRKKEVPEAPEESNLLPASTKPKRRHVWHWTTKRTGEIPIPSEVQRSWRPNWWNSKNEFDSKKYEKLRDCLQALFVEIGGDKPRGMTNLMLANRTALISVIGPGGESNPVYQFEVRFKSNFRDGVSEWSVRDPVTKKFFDPEDFVLDNFCFDRD